MRVVIWGAVGGRGWDLCGRRGEKQSPCPSGGKMGAKIVGVE